MSYEIKSTADGKFMFNLKAGNNQVILTSEVYEQKQSALGGIASVQANGPEAKNFEVRTAVAGEPYFVLKAQNGLIIGTSQMYASTAALEVGIASVQANASSQDVVTVE